MITLPRNWMEEGLGGASTTQHVAFDQIDWDDATEIQRRISYCRSETFISRPSAFTVSCVKV